MSIATAACPTCGPESKCLVGQRLWSELIEARDAVYAIEESGSRKGHKPALNEFARRRGAYRLHRGLSL